MVQTSHARVSVVIPAFNRADKLNRVLGAYLAQTGVYEVIVIDNGSSDRTPLVLEEWLARDARLRVVRLPVNLRQAGARNAGADTARGELVFYGEDDYEPAPGHVQTLVEHLERSAADVIAGRRINVLPDETYEHALRRVNSYHDPLIERWAGVGNHHIDTGADVEAPLLDACALIRRQVLDRIRFDMNFRGNGWREESDFQLAALAAGFKLVHCPHVLGFHTPGGLGKAAGGSRSGTRLGYEAWVVRNNLRFLRKHWAYLHSGASELRVPPGVLTAVLLQAVLRALRARRKLARLARWQVDGAPQAAQARPGR